tara:strand:- start:253 stop:555 length:303 start_codon:yes stop_codon:yes gene_type:complete
MIKLKNILLEKKDLDSKIIQKIDKMTDRNDHLGARTHLSYYLEGGNKGKFFKYYDAASQINAVFGHTPPELSKLNQKMEKELYKEIKKKFANAAAIISVL